MSEKTKQVLKEAVGELYARAAGQKSTANITAYAYLKAADGTFIGSLVRSPLSRDSIFNKFGPYGSKFSPTSIFNRMGDFGSEFSKLSAYNRFTTTPPTIILHGQPVAHLTKNISLGGENVNPDHLEEWLRRRGF